MHVRAQSINQHFSFCHLEFYVLVALGGPVVELLGLCRHLRPGLGELGAAVVRNNGGVPLSAQLEGQLHRSATHTTHTRKHTQTHAHTSQAC